MIETYFLGDKIKQLRREWKMTQSQLAEALGLSKSAVSQFESGVNRPSLDTLDKLSNLFLHDFTQDYLQDESLTKRRKRRGNGGVIGRLDFENLYVELPFSSRDSYQEFIELRHREEETPHDVEWVWVLKRDGVDYSNASVIEIQGNRMLPRYPEQSHYVVRIVEKGNWQYSTGVHLIVLKNNMVLLRRIISNDTKVIQLVSDTSDERIQVALDDVDYLWKLGEAVYMPAEDQ
ncbi:helix-turn-helix transcriptional regulator [Hymenobacter sp. BT559]|uniref:helix-turn-helix transcriptional regulator n=1 Tax=Hymenobacter sp. BT559 TaxID=2795729 RepID=UPI0018EA7675|nr:helix-turn-helix transcriptional regulator [Hymenobacter sp. BT559]MBJ6141788.1 helix-turn-helix transcriptional regulator [Hymenobacter sp. BT559]